MCELACATAVTGAFVIDAASVALVGYSVFQLVKNTSELPQAEPLQPESSLAEERFNPKALGLAPLWIETDPKQHIGQPNAAPDHATIATNDQDDLMAPKASAVTSTTKEGVKENEQAKDDETEAKADYPASVLMIPGGEPIPFIDLSKQVDAQLQADGGTEFTLTLPLTPSQLASNDSPDGVFEWKVNPKGECGPFWQVKLTAPEHRAAGLRGRDLMISVVKAAEEKGVEINAIPTMYDDKDPRLLTNLDASRVRLRELVHGTVANDANALQFLPPGDVANDMAALESLAEPEQITAAMSAAPTSKTLLKLGFELPRADVIAVPGAPTSIFGTFVRPPGQRLTFTH